MWTHSHRVVSLDLICLNPSAQGAYQFEKQGRERTPAHKRPLPCYLLVPFLHWDWVRAPHNCFSILFYVSPSLSVSGCLVLSFTHSPCLSHTLSNIASTHSDTVSKDILPSYSRNSKLLFLLLLLLFFAALAISSLLTPAAFSSRSLPLQHICPFLFLSAQRQSLSPQNAFHQLKGMRHMQCRLHVPVTACPIHKVLPQP